MRRRESVADLERAPLERAWEHDRATRRQGVIPDDRGSFYVPSLKAGTTHSDAWVRACCERARAFLAVADGIVFVVDSQAMREEANVERLERLRDDLRVEGRELSEIPILF